MKTNHSLLVRATAAAIVLLFILFPAAPSASAFPVIDATWLGPEATDGNWNNGMNWTGGTAPNAMTAKATFPTSPTSSFNPIFLTAPTSIAQVTFKAGADPLTIETITFDLDFYGLGIINNSGQTQTFINGGVLDPTITFHGSSSAGNALIINQADGANVYVEDSATAANAIIINQGSASFVEIAGAASGGLATVINQNPTAFIDISHLTTSGTTLGAIAGNGTIYLGSKNLTVGGNNLSTIFSGVISDGVPPVKEKGGEGPVVTTGGSLTKVGTGTLTLTGMNTYTGNTYVNGGTLLVDGAIVSPMTFINPGGMLGGTGIIGGSVINNGTLMPGDAPGTINFKGNLTQGSGGTLVIQIASTSVFDRLIIGGAANLGGTLIVDPLSGFKLTRGEKFEFLFAGGGVNGQFANLIQPDTGTILKFALVYEGNDVLLEAEVGSFVLNGLTPNQTSVAKELDRVVNDNRAGKLLDFLSTEPLGQLPNDFDKIAAEEYTSIFTISESFDNVQSLTLQRRTDDIRSGASGFSAAGLAINGINPSFNGPVAFRPGTAGPSGDEGKESKEVKQVAPAETRWGAFLTGTGEWVGVGDDFNARGYQIATGGFTLGVDYKVCSHFAVGLMAGYVGTGVDLNNGGRVFVNGGKLGLYATMFQNVRPAVAPTMSKDSSKEAPAPAPSIGGGFYADLGVTGGYSGYDVHRAALEGTARGSTDGGDLNALFGAGYDFKAGGLTFGPTATFNYTYVGIGDFTETGSLAPLHFQSQGQESVRTAFGAKASYECKCGSVIVKPEVRAAWQHEYGDAAYEIDSSFANGAGNTFTVTGPRIGRDSLLVGAGFAVQWNDRCSTYVYYDGELGRARYDSQSVSGGFRLAF